MIQAAFVLGIGFALVMSCKYDEMLPPEPDPTLQVKFSEDIVPIFNASCNGSSCHNGSGPSPDLRASVAYDNLWGAELLDTIEPANSEIYLWMTGAKGLTMPPQGVQPADAATILQWIDQGAKNN